MRGRALAKALLSCSVLVLVSGIALALDAGTAGEDEGTDDDKCDCQNVDCKVGALPDGPNDFVNTPPAGGGPGIESLGRVGVWYKGKQPTFCTGDQHSRMNFIIHSYKPDHENPHNRIKVVYSSEITKHGEAKRYATGTDWWWDANFRVEDNSPKFVAVVSLPTGGTGPILPTVILENARPETADASAADAANNNQGTTSSMDFGSGVRLNGKFSGEVVVPEGVVSVAVAVEFESHGGVSDGDNCDVNQELRLAWSLTTTPE